VFHRIVRSAPRLALALAATACHDSSSPGEPAHLSVHLTDRAGEVSRVWLDLGQVYLQGGSESRVNLFDGPSGWIEVTELVGTTQMLVADAEVDPSLYHQLRMVILAAVLETELGDVYVSGDPAELPAGLTATGELRCPSCEQSGLKVIIPSDGMDIGEGDSFAMILDFDVPQSFGHDAGGSGMWVMHPTIFGVLLEDANGDGIPDNLQPGAIQGTVMLDGGVSIPECPSGTARGLDDFVPFATAVTLVDDLMSPIVRAGVTEAGGGFSIDFLQADDYDLGYQGQLDFVGASLVFTADVIPMQVPVSDDLVDGVEYTITEAQCVPAP